MLEYVVWSDGAEAVRCILGQHYNEKEAELVHFAQLALAELRRTHKVDIKWVKGHVGILGNEMADEFSRRRDLGNISINMEGRKFAPSWTSYAEPACMGTKTARVTQSVLESTEDDEEIAAMDLEGDSGNGEMGVQSHGSKSGNQATTIQAFPMYAWHEEEKASSSAKQRQNERERDACVQCGLHWVHGGKCGRCHNQEERAKWGMREYGGGE